MKKINIAKEDIPQILFWLSIFIIYVILSVCVNHYYFIAMGVTIIVLSFRKILLRNTMIDFTYPLALIPFGISISMTIIKFMKPLLETCVR